MNYFTYVYIVSNKKALSMGWGEFFWIGFLVGGCLGLGFSFLVGVGGCDHG
jgi:hypothetical protein